jgi:hypothetical protein
MQEGALLGGGRGEQPFEPLSLCPHCHPRFLEWSSMCRWSVSSKARCVFQEAALPEGKPGVKPATASASGNRIKGTHILHKGRRKEEEGSFFFF